MEPLTLKEFDGFGDLFLGPNFGVCVTISDVTREPRSADPAGFIRARQLLFNGSNTGALV